MALSRSCPNPAAKVDTIEKQEYIPKQTLRPYAGRKLTVIAWLWARTVASPDPMQRGAHVPLASSFVLSSRTGKEAIIVPIVEQGSYRFAVKARGVGPDELAKAKTGTKAGRGANFVCLLSGAPISDTHVKAESMAGRMGVRLMAVVVEGERRRVYLAPTEKMQNVAKEAQPDWKPEQEMNRDTRDLVSGRGYGFFIWADLFTSRQLTALTTFSDLAPEARERVLRDARAADMHDDTLPLSDGGTGAQAYADAVATYLGLCVSRQANRTSNLSIWHTGRETVEQVFGRQALPMVWDFCEGNPFSDSTGNFVGQVDWLANVMDFSPISDEQTAIIERCAAEETRLADGAIIATDPPYYDNIGYADLSDFFYIWQRRTLRGVWPDLFRRILVPKDEELVAASYRHGGKDAAEKFFMDGMGRALRRMQRSGNDDFPVTIYYAFKQSEVAKEGLTSPGWATFLQGVFEAGYVIDGTWPVRTELPGALKKKVNALASSILLVCRKRPADAPTITRRDFVKRLRAELPKAIGHIRAGGVGPSDMAQAAIGPGMGIFTACARVLEPDDTPMTVRMAIALVNRTRDEISGEEAAGYDPETRFCIDWFEAFDMAVGRSGDAITMAQAYDIGIDALVDAGAFHAPGGDARLLRRDELPADWSPSADRHLTHWECAQHLARVLEAPDGGGEAAARLLTDMGPDNGEAARLLAYRLYDICERKGRAAEAQVWNMLVREWPAIEAAAATAPAEAELGV